MIKSNITVEVNSTELDGVLIVPSAVFTSTVQEEELDLTKTPNFQIVVGKGDEINDTVEVSFTVEEVEYTANMKVVNRNGSTVTLQYVDGLTAEDAPEIDPIYVRGWVNETNYDEFIEMNYNKDHNYYYIDLVPTEGAQNAGKFYITTSNDPETWQQHCLGDDGLSGVAIENYDTEYQLTEGRETYYIIYDPCRLTIFPDTLIATFNR